MTIIIAVSCTVKLKRKAIKSKNKVQAKLTPCCNERSSTDRYVLQRVFFLALAPPSKMTPLYNKMETQDGALAPLFSQCCSMPDNSCTDTTQ